MNVGTRYPEGLRKAREAHSGHGPEEAEARGFMQGDREGAGQVALGSEHRGSVAQVCGLATPIWMIPGGTAPLP